MFCREKIFDDSVEISIKKKDKSNYFDFRIYNRFLAEGIASFKYNELEEIKQMITEALSYSKCITEIENCIDEDDYKEIVSMIDDLYYEDKLTSNQCDELKEIHYKKNNIYIGNELDDQTWEAMVTCDPDLSEQ